MVFSDEQRQPAIDKSSDDRPNSILPVSNQSRTEWNNTSTDHLSQITIPQLFQLQSKLTPDAVALVFGDRQLSYDELNRQANRLAHYLVSLGVGPEVLVGLCVRRSLDLIIALLAILKTGGAYVPLDPSYPGERLEYLIADAEISLLLTQQEIVGSLPEGRVPLLCLDDQRDLIALFPDSDIDVMTEADNLAYVSYTSGSTGRPKGVGVPHRAVIRLVNRANYVSLSPDEVFLQFAPVSFDASTFEIWGSLLNGGRLVIMLPNAPSLEELGETIVHEKITTLWLTSSLFNQMVDACPQSLVEVRQLLAGGDVLSPQHVRKLLNQMIDGRVINGYGPTESTTFACCYSMNDSSQVGQSVSIGRPISNTSVYLLDVDLNPVPVEVDAELYIGGAGLARGYLNRPTITAERFIPDPFSQQSGARMYMTGDLARYMPDGNIEFLGRLDHQIKLRGFRIEPGEVESILNEHPAVGESAVLARNDATGEKQLIAYIVRATENQASGSSRQSSKALHDRVYQWQNLYDEVIYRRIGENNFGQSNPTFNITGWDSSYTGQPISAEEMREQVEQTVERILRSRPRKVIEIGCGTGLLLFRVAPFCTDYLGTDFSEVALDYVKQQLLKPEYQLSHVKLMQIVADDFQQIEPESFDAVILNSIIQHFPNIDYLLRVIEGAIEIVRPGGFIFVGDIRSLPLLRAFHLSVQLSRAPSSLSADEFDQTVEQQMAQEEELVIDPAFFEALKDHFSKISKINIHLKRGRFHNELTRFRYDVFIEIGGFSNPITDIKWLDWQEQKLTLTNVKRILEEGGQKSLGIAGIPNARLSKETLAIEILNSTHRPETLRRLRDLLKEDSARSFIDPEEFWNLGESLDYSTEVKWSGNGRADCFDVVMRRNANSGNDTIIEATSALSARPNTPKQWQDYANNPLRLAQTSALVPELRQYLKERLPDYMIPSVFLMMDCLPLTPNGKLDRKALPLPDSARAYSSRIYKPPRTPVEEAIAEVWQKVLGIERVGIDDNFFEIGGNSLKAVQVVEHLKRDLNVEMPTISLFDKTTISDLVSLLQPQKSAGVEADRMMSIIERGRRRREKNLARSRDLD